MTAKGGDKFNNPMGERRDRIQRINNRLKTQIEANTGGEQSICAKCGRVFNQKWMDQLEKFTQYNTCDKCRTATARGNSKATIEYNPHPKQVLVHESKARFKLLACLPPGETILGSNKNIEDLTSDDFVYGTNGTINNVLDSLSRDYDGNVYEINARYIMPFTVTDEHPIWLTKVHRNDNFDAYKKGRRPKKTIWSVEDQKWVNACEIKQYFEQQDTYNKWCLKIPRLKSGLRVSEWRMRELSCWKDRYKPFFPINADTAWAIGIFVAEGNICPSSITYNFGSHERNFVERITKIFTDLDYHVSERTSEEEHSTRVTITSTALAELFKEKISTMSDNVQIPTDILLHPDEEIVFSFLRGYYDGDGSYDAKRGMICGKTAGKKLVMQLQLLLARFGYLAHITITKRKQSTIRGRLINNDNLVYEIRSTYGELIKRLGYGNPQKQWREYGFVQEDAIYVPLSGVKESHYSGKVYNISTADETFLVSNVVTHNCGARFGKDRCMIMEFIRKFAEMLSEERGSDMIPSVHGWIIAPTYILARQVWRELKAFFPREWVTDLWESDKMVQTVNGGMIEVRSADDPNSLVGVGLDIVLITEAARIRNFDEVWSNLEMRLASPGRGPNGQGGLGLINSTPRGLGFFYDMFKWGQKDTPYYDEDWESWQFSSWDNPYLMRKDKKFLEGIKKRFPARIYAQEVEGQFLPEGNCMFPTADECAIYVGEGAREIGESYVIGYDPAKSIDYSGVVVRNSRGETVYIKQWSGWGWDRQFDEIAKLSRIYNHAPVVMDRTGLGETIPSQLSKRGLEVEDVFFSPKEKENMVNNLAMLIEQKRISYPKFEPLLLEFKDYQYSVSPKTKSISFGNASKTGHDDLVTAMMLAYKNFDIFEEGLPYMGLIGGIRKKTA